MSPHRRRAALTISLLVFGVILSGCFIQPAKNKPRMTLFIGVDASGSFQSSGSYENATAFLAHYIYGHLNEMDGLTKPRELYVGSIGGQSMGEAKAFHPIHDFESKDIAGIEIDLKEWFPPTDQLTDFNSFFEQVARISKERNLTLSPITVIIVTDGIPDTRGRKVSMKNEDLFKNIDVSPMEYLSRNLTLRITYPDSRVSDQWRKHVKRKRVRLWTVDATVMKGWIRQLDPEKGPKDQHRLWKWVHDNVDYRVRSRSL